MTKTRKEGPSLLIRNIPERLHRKFKAWCNLRGMTMTKKIISLVRETVRKDEHNRRDT